MMDDRLVGIYFIVTGVIATFVYAYYDSLEYILWFCNHTSFFLGIGFLKNKRSLIAGEVLLGLVPQLVWVSSFGVGLVGAATFKATEYMFDPSYPFPLYLVSLNHFVLLGILVYSFRRFVISKSAFAFALLHGVLLILSSFIDSSKNINCIQEPCIFLLNLQFYSLAWPFVYFAAVMLPIAVLNRSFHSSS